MLGQQSLQRAEGPFRMRQTRAMGQPWALQLHVPKHRSYSEAVMTSAVAHFAAVRAASEPKQNPVDLLPHHCPLDVLQDQLAFRQREAEGLHGYTLPLELSYILHHFLTGVAYRDELEAELHALPAFSPAR